MNLLAVELTPVWFSCYHPAHHSQPARKGRRQRAEGRSVEPDTFAFGLQVAEFFSNWEGGMASINTGRVIVGGLVAGLVANIIDIATGFLMQDELTANLERLHLPAMGTSAIVSWVAVDFAYGILMVLTYACIRPRFGPGPKTALFAGFLLLTTVTVVLYGFLGLGFFPASTYVKSALFALLSTGAGALAGAALYKE